MVDKEARLITCWVDSVPRDAVAGPSYIQALNNVAISFLGFGPARERERYRAMPRARILRSSLSDCYGLSCKQLIHSPVQPNIIGYQDTCWVVFREDTYLQTPASKRSK